MLFRSITRVKTTTKGRSDAGNYRNKKEDELLSFTSSPPAGEMWRPVEAHHLSDTPVLWLQQIWGKLWHHWQSVHPPTNFFTLTLWEYALGDMKMMAPDTRLFGKCVCLCVCFPKRQVYTNWQCVHRVCVHIRPLSVHNNEPTNQANQTYLCADLHGLYVNDNDNEWEQEKADVDDDAAAAATAAADVQGKQNIEEN